MYYKNYLIVTMLTFFVGSIFMPRIIMEAQDRNQNQFEQAKNLIDYFFIVRVPRQNNIPVRNEGAEPNGFEYYKKLIKKRFEISNHKNDKLNYSIIDHPTNKYPCG